MIINTAIFFFIFMKMLNYFKVHPDYGLLSELVYGINKRLIPFLFFLFI